MFHAFMSAPFPVPTQSGNTSTTKSLFDFLFNQKQKTKQNKNEAYSSLENSLWGSSITKTTKELLFAK